MMNTRRLAMATTVLWIFAVLCAGCDVDTPPAQTTQNELAPQQTSVILVPTADAAVPDNSPIFTIDLRDYTKVYVLERGPTSKAYDRVRLMCPTGVKM